MKVMMRRLGGILTMGVGVVLLAASGAIVSPPSAAETMLESHGWWYKPNQVPNNLAVPPAPPGAQSDGLYVAGDLSGPFALAAVRYLGYGSGTLTLEFSREGSTGIPSIAACPAVTKWDAATAGRWEGKPMYDCARKSEGVVSQDGSKMAFKLDPSMQRVDGVYDLALAPVGPVPFTASFNAPRSESLVTDGSGSPEAPAATAEPFQPSEPVPSGDFGPFETTFPAFDDPRTVAPESAAPIGPQPLTPRTTTPIVPAVANPLALPDDRNERLAAVVGLGLLLLGAWWFGGRTIRPPRLLGSVAGRAVQLEATAVSEEATVRGVGRFARPRRG